MKVSLNSVRKFTDVDISVDELIAKIGAQLGAVEDVWQSGAKYDGVVVAKVVNCEKHPNADKLNVCTIDDGGITPEVKRDEQGYVQVVCGAPNARVGITVAWLPPGSTVPSTYFSDKFVLEARELRGVVSNGMLASPSELAISDNHDGILEIEEDLAPGTPFRTLYDLDDVTIEIENKMFTHRPDCFGVLGVAREIAGIQHMQFRSPDWYLNSADFSKENDLPLVVQNEIPQLVPRYMAVAMSNVEIKSSPVWLQALLTRVGLKTINNVVDITNYLSYITAQPLHAFDYDKVAAQCDGDAKLIVRKPRDGETIALLNGKTITPRPDAIMIATDKELVGIAGVMGGTTTEVDENTKNIIIEVANFDMYNIRRTSMQHGLFTDAVTRFNKGQSPLQNDRVLGKAMEMMNELSGATQASNVIDSRNDDLEVYSKYGNFNTDKGMPAKVFSWGSLSAPIMVTASFINQRLGTELKPEEITKLLSNVEMRAHQDNQEDRDEIEVIAPFWRTDIEIAEDIVEEVGRLLGFDKLPLELPKRVVVPTKLDAKLELNSRIRHKLASLGANEVLTYSFVHGKLLAKADQDPELAFKLTNALSPDLQYYRLSMMPSLLANVHSNIKAGHENLALFELGKVHGKPEIDEDKVPKEFDRLAFVIARKQSGHTAFFEAKNYVDQLLSASYSPLDPGVVADHKLMTQLIQPFEPTRSAFLKSPEGNYIGVVGEYKQSVIKNFKLPEASAGFEVFLSAFKQSAKSKKYRALSRFPSISQDLCLEFADTVTASQANAVVGGVISEQTTADFSCDIELIDIYSSDSIGAKKRYTYRLVLTSYTRTLNDEVASKLLDLVEEAAQKEHSAIRI